MLVLVFGAVRAFLRSELPAAVPPSAEFAAAFVAALATRFDPFAGGFADERELPTPAAAAALDALPSGGAAFASDGAAAPLAVAAFGAVAFGPAFAAAFVTVRGWVVAFVVAALVVLALLAAVLDAARAAAVDFPLVLAAVLVFVALAPLALAPEAIGDAVAAFDFGAAFATVFVASFFVAVADEARLAGLAAAAGPTAGDPLERPAAVEGRGAVPALAFPCALSFDEAGAVVADAGLALALLAAVADVRVVAGFTVDVDRAAFARVVSVVFAAVDFLPVVAAFGTTGHLLGRSGGHHSGRLSEIAGCNGPARRCIPRAPREAFLVQGTGPRAALVAARTSRS